MGETEFNLFPSSSDTNHIHHKKQCNHIDALSLSAVYGANGAGKSNLIRAIADLKTIVTIGGVSGTIFHLYKFQLNKNNHNEPISMAIEFFQNEKIYYYSVDFDKNIVLYESLSIVEKDSDSVVFERKTNETQIITFGNKYYKDNNKNNIFRSVLQDKLLNKSTLLLSFMATNYANEIAVIKDVYSWFINNLIIVDSNYLLGVTAHILDTNQAVLDMANKLLPEMKTGITSITIDKRVLDESQLDDNWSATINELKATPGRVIPIPKKSDGRITASTVYENGKIILKELQPIHKLGDGSDLRMPIDFESDGTIRLINYIPLFYAVINEGCVAIVDEIERSLHPILIKEIISKISDNKETKGQLIFTTHESCLLDQGVFRSDEIWFAEKDLEGATHLYPLSDFNIRNMSQIERGYMMGRYGGIPFLSNFKDLNWSNDSKA